MSTGAEGMTRLSLVIPCYNEENTLADTVGRCLALKEHGIAVELVIVDDCSSDKSLAVAEGLRRAHPEISLFRHERNQGKGAALRTGFLHSSGNYVGIQDADRCVRWPIWPCSGCSRFAGWACSQRRGSPFCWLRV